MHHLSFSPRKALASFLKSTSMLQSNSADSGRQKCEDCGGESGKGGTGKTTLTSALAMRASDDFKAVGMLDLNHDQASLSQWNATRGELLNPKLMPVPENLTEGRAQVRVGA